jgi:hypothetical protein
VRDEGSLELLRKKRAAAGERGDVEITDHIGILTANALIDVEELVTLRMIEAWIRLSRRTHVIGSMPVGGFWAAILSGQGGRRWVPPAIGADRGAGDHAWRRIWEIRDRFAAEGLLPALALVFKVAEGVAMPASRAELVLLKAALRVIAHLVSYGVRRRRAAG